MEREGGGGGKGGPPRPSMAFLSLRKDSRLLYAQSPKFSEIVANQQSGNNNNNNASQKTVISHFTGVSKKIQAKRGQTVGGNRAPPQDSDFKVAEMESDGKRSVRSLSGLRRDSEVMYVPKYDISTNNMGKRGKINGLFDNEVDDGEEEEEGTPRGGSESPPTTNNNNRGGGTVGRRAGSISGIGLTRSISQPDYIQQVIDPSLRGCGSSLSLTILYFLLL
jgi:hypothetical protein